MNINKNRDLDNLIRSKGKEIFEFAGNQPSAIFNRKWWYGKMMDWCIKNDKFKVQMFRFIDVLPYLMENHAEADVVYRLPWLIRESIRGTRAFGPVKP